MMDNSELHSAKASAVVSPCICDVVKATISLVPKDLICDVLNVEISVDVSPRNWLVVIARILVVFMTKICVVVRLANWVPLKPAKTDVVIAPI